MIVTKRTKRGQAEAVKAVYLQQWIRRIGRPRPDNEKLDRGIARLIQKSEDAGISPAIAIRLTFDRLPPDQCYSCFGTKSPPLNFIGSECNIKNLVNLGCRKERVVAMSDVDASEQIALKSCIANACVLASMIATRALCDKWLDAVRQNEDHWAHAFVVDYDNNHPH